LSYTWVLASSDDLESSMFVEDTGESTRFEIDQGSLASILADEGIGMYDDIQLFHQVSASDGEDVTTGVISSFTLIRGNMTATAEGEELPVQTMLLGHYPNPFYPVTSITYALAESAEVRLIVYDVLGREVRILIDGLKNAGTHEAIFDASGLPSGVYMYRMVTQAFSDTKIMTVAK